MSIVASIARARDPARERLQRRRARGGTGALARTSSTSAGRGASRLLARDRPFHARDRTSLTTVRSPSSAQWSSEWRATTRRRSSAPTRAALGGVAAAAARDRRPPARSDHAAARAAAAASPPSSGAKAAFVDSTGRAQAAASKTALSRVAPGARLVRADDDVGARRCSAGISARGTASSRSTRPRRRIVAAIALSSSRDAPRSSARQRRPADLERRRRCRRRCRSDGVEQRAEPLPARRATEREEPQRALVLRGGGASNTLDVDRMTDPAHLRRRQRDSSSDRRSATTSTTRVAARSARLACQCVYQSSERHAPQARTAARRAARTAGTMCTSTRVGAARATARAPARTRRHDRASLRASNVRTDDVRRRRRSSDVARNDRRARRPALRAPRRGRPSARAPGAPGRAPA